MSIMGIMERIGEGAGRIGLELGCAAKRVEIGMSNMKAERKIRAAQKPSSLSEEEEAEAAAGIEKNIAEYQARMNECGGLYTGLATLFGNFDKETREE